MASNPSPSSLPALGIEAISVFGLPPVQFVEMAADLGCRQISTGLSSYDFGIEEHPPYSLREDANLRRELQAAMRDRGVTISLAEGCNIREHSDVWDYQNDLDIFAGLGAERINVVSMEPDFARTVDQLAQLAEIASERGFRVTIEPVPGMTIPDLATALTIIAEIGRDDIRLMIDTMHFARSGCSASDLEALAPGLIDYVQLCDAPIEPRFESYFEESMFERMVPGEGELGIAALLDLLPANVVYALEVPQRSLALDGLGPRERLAPCVAAARKLLEARETSRG